MRMRNICSPRTCSAILRAIGPRHAKTYRNFAAEYARLQQERIAAYREFIADVNTGAYPAPQHVVPIEDVEFAKFVARIKV